MPHTHHELPKIRYLKPERSIGRRLFGYLVGFPSALFLFLSLLVINVLQMSTMLVAPFSSRLFRAVNRWCANTWWGSCVVWAEKLLGVNFVITGDKLPERENALVIANHQEMSDIIVLFPLAWRCRRLGDMKWFVKDVIKYVPGIGWGMLFLDCLFVKRDWMADRRKIEKTFERINSHDTPFWLISFSEGTRITPKKLAASQRYAAKVGQRKLVNVMVPRTKGFIASMQGLGHRAEAVYDVTIGYQEGIPSLWQFICGGARNVHLKISRYPVSELPKDEAGLSQWLLTRFEEKDALLDRFNASGRFA